MKLRRVLIATIGLGLLAAPLTAGAQQPAKTARIGFLALDLHTPETSYLLEAFRTGLRELGYVEGQNIVLEFRSAEGKAERLPDLAGELIRRKVDVIVAGQQPSPQVAKQATGTIPIIFTVVGDPVGQGLVASLARPGGNITGLASISPELVGKLLELLREAAPKVSRVAVLKNPGNPGHQRTAEEADRAARALGLRPQIVRARSPADIDAAFTAMTKQRVGGILVLRDGLFLAQRAQIAALAVKSHLPTVHGHREEAEAGGLLAYGPNVAALYHRAATYVDKILKGAKPADLPVEQPTRFELVVNLKTAKALGLTIPPSILVRADQVIQ